MSLALSLSRALSRALSLARINCRHGHTHTNTHTHKHTHTHTHTHTRAHTHTLCDSDRLETEGGVQRQRRSVGLVNVQEQLPSAHDTTTRRRQMPCINQSSHLDTSRHVTSRHVTSRHVTSRHVTSHRGDTMSGDRPQSLARPSARRLRELALAELRCHAACDGPPRQHASIRHSPHRRAHVSGCTHRNAASTPSVMRYMTWSPGLHDASTL
jgi:hypothetical protein